MNPGDSFIDLHYAVEDAATAAVALNLHRRVAILEADRRVGALVVSIMRWGFGSTAVVVIVERILKAVS
jgi:hypothetical protein